MMFIRNLLIFPILFSFCCEEIDDFDPYYNNIEGPAYYDMSALMLDSGSHITGCISNIDLMQLYKPFLDSEPKSLSLTIYLNGKFLSGGGEGSYSPYFQCMESLDDIPEGPHELVLEVYIGSDPYSRDHNDISLKNVLYQYAHHKSFKETIYIDHSPIDEIEVIRAEKIDDIVYIEWTASQAENFAYYHINKVNSYEEGHFIYGRNNTLYVDTVGSYWAPRYSLRVSNRKDNFIIDDITID
ncbi:hypothetical protein GCM10009122_10440 [Fulvivirga kasyanovii]|uniref:DUF4249 family protein n=1 Tax=Fulvivirga kasyanovii TaxID=396812 RepID=A0ABW9RVD8_9BACT|nr:hypothetical protein [Fulvivirga kasyanovii]MTI28157.1 hypothetical protein [Fulvivirga kasyanovii]